MRNSKYFFKKRSAPRNLITGEIGQYFHFYKKLYLDGIISLNAFFRRAKEDRNCEMFKIANSPLSLLFVNKPGLPGNHWQSSKTVPD